MAAKKSNDIDSTTKWGLLDRINTPTLVITAKIPNTIVFANESMAELSGFEISEIIGESIESFFQGPDKDKFLAMVDILSERDAQLKELDVVFKKRSKRKVHVNVFSQNTEFYGEHFIVMSLHNLSEIKILQRENEKTKEEMLQVSKLADIGRLAAGVAHELNNPLMIIQGFTETIEDLCVQKQNNPLSKEILWQVDSIYKGVNRMVSIISKLTRLSRDDKQLNLKSIDPIEIVEEALVLTRSKLRGSDIEIIKSYQECQIVKVDTIQIEQILINILNNAAQALDKIEGKRKIEVKVFNSGGFCRISVTNNGPEIPKIVQSKIFTPFFTTKEVGTGTGLGLSVSYGIMKAHGGDLTFTSDNEGGTCFELIFPAHKVPLKVHTTSGAAGLVVDDEPLARQLVSNKLRQNGYRILEAANGEEALEVIIKNENLKFLFTDVRMPRMDGIKLIEEIRKQPSDLMIFILTGFSGIPSIERAANSLSVDGFLEKPINHENFLLAIEQIESRLNKKSREKKSA